MSSDKRSSGAPQLLVLNGPLAGSAVEIGERLTLGRRPENGLRLTDELASRFHAVVEEREGKWVVEDLGSRSGTFVDGAPIQRVAELRDGSELLIGQTMFRFEECPAPLLGQALPPRGMQLERTRSVVTLVPMSGTPFRESLAKDTTTELRRAGEHLHTLLTANSIIASELDLERLFTKILDQIWGKFPAHRAVIFAKLSEREPLSTVATRTVSGAALEHPVSHGIVDQAYNQRVGVLTVDAGADERFDARQSIVDLGIRSAICVPMLHQDSVLGVIYLDTVGVTHAFTEDDLRLLTGIAGPAGGAVRNALLVKKLRATAIDTILRLAVAAEYRDDDTGFHIHRMSDYAEIIAVALGLPPDFSETLKLASPMHDVGKIGVPDAILKKPGRLTPEEFEEMKQHTVKGGAILGSSDSDLLKMAERIALTHHERFDGTGYPHKLKGENIPLEGRIVAVADVFDALTNRRCYKPPFSVEEAFLEISKGVGSHFDPTIAACFLDVKDRILEVRGRYLDLEAAESAHGAPSMATVLGRRIALGG